MSLTALNISVLWLENSVGSYSVRAIWVTVSIEREIRISQAEIKSCPPFISDGAEKIFLSGHYEIWGYFWGYVIILQNVFINNIKHFT